MNAIYLRASGVASLVLAVATIIILGIVGIWDVVALTNGGNVPTVSQFIVTWSREYPFVPFFLGFVTGHLFFPSKYPPLN